VLLTAEGLQKERDRFMVTKPEDINLPEEMILFLVSLLYRKEAHHERMGKTRIQV